MAYGNVPHVDTYIGDINSQPDVGADTASLDNKAPFSVSRIEYYASLNSFDRSTARDPSEPMETIVDLLSGLDSICLLFGSLLKTRFTAQTAA